MVVGNGEDVDVIPGNDGKKVQLLVRHSALADQSAHLLQTMTRHEVFIGSSQKNMNE